MGLGGAQIGYLASKDEQLTHGVRRRLPLGNINGIAEYLLWILPEFREEWEASFRRTRADVVSFSRMLDTIPELEVHPSQANYLFCRTPEAWPSAKHVATMLAKRYGVLVQNCENQCMKYGDRYLRLTVLPYEENRYLVSALRRINEELVEWSTQSKRAGTAYHLGC